MAVTVSLPVTVSRFGANGQGISGIDLNFATQVTAFNSPTPITTLVIQIGINDAASGTSQNAFLTSYRSVYNKALALNPAMKFLLVNALVDGEVWQAGPVWGGNTFDANTAARNTDIVTIRNELVALGLQAEVADVRAAMLLMEVQRNPLAASGGRCTLDGVHPTPEVEMMMGRTAFAKLSLVASGAGDHVHVVGDSITNSAGPNGGWQDEPTGFFDMMTQAVPGHRRTSVT